MYNTEVIIFI